MPQWQGKTKQSKNRAQFLGRVAFAFCRGTNARQFHFVLFCVGLASRLIPRAIMLSLLHSFSILLVFRASLRCHSYLVAYRDKISKRQSVTNCYKVRQRKAPSGAGPGWLFAPGRQPTSSGNRDQTTSSGNRGQPTSSGNNTSSGNKVCRVSTSSGNNLQWK